MNGIPADEDIRFLNGLNRELKNGYPIDLRDAVLRRQYGMSQICINTRGCTAGMNGSCLFCNYPRGKGITLESAESAVDELLRSVKSTDRSVLIGSCGSILDPSEVPEGILDAVLDRLSILKDKTIIFESRLETITDDILKRIGMKLNSNRINIEFGLEAVDPFILKYCLNKHINLEAIRRKVSSIHSQGFTTTANILVGAPFLTEEEQIGSAIDSVNWALDVGIDEIVLFPVNIRHGTVLKELYDIGIYRPINYEMIVSVLHYVEKEALDKISFSWSDPNEVDDPVIFVHPAADNEVIFTFFKDFMSKSSSEERSKILYNYIGNRAITKQTKVNYDNASDRMTDAVRELRSGLPNP